MAKAHALDRTLRTLPPLLRRLQVARKQQAPWLLRLVQVADETAAYVTVWIRRIMVVAISGYAVAEAGLLFGLPWSAYDAILRLSLLVVTMLLVIVILQNRVQVGEALRAPPLAEDETPDRARRLFRGLRDRLADVWHLLAILWLFALWGVWALEVRDGVGTAYGTALYSVDAARGVVYFAANNNGNLVVITGRHFDLAACAADIWRQKAANTALAYDFSTDNHKMSRSQMFEACTRMAQYYDGMTEPNAIGVQRSDDVG
jgi:hypothetical protein